MTANECINTFSNHLFWDVHKEDIDIDRHSKYIIKRVLEYGVWNDWMVLRIYYGLPRIVEEVKKMRDLEPRALAYIASISNTPKEEFRCYNTKQSNQPPRDSFPARFRFVGGGGANKKRSLT